MKFKWVIPCENWVQKWPKSLYIFGIYPSDLLKNISFVKMKRWSYLHIHCKLASPKINCLILYELVSQIAHDNILFNLVQVRMAQAGMVANSLSRDICIQVRLMLRQKLYYLSRFKYHMSYVNIFPACLLDNGYSFQKINL